MKEHESKEHEDLNNGVEDAAETNAVLKEVIDWQDGVVGLVRAAVVTS